MYIINMQPIDISLKIWYAVQVFIIYVYTPTI